MATVSLTNALTVQRDIGRSRVFSHFDTGSSKHAYWDGTSAINLVWLCDTEGDLVHNPNMTIDKLTAPELAADAALEAKVKGERPVVDLPAIYADPATRGILSPTEAASGGYSTGRPVKELTLVIFAEELFFNSTTNEYDLTLATNAGAWTLGGNPLTGLSQRKQNLFGLTVWLWRCFSMKAPFRFSDTDHGKSVETVEIECMLDTSKPEGHLLYTVGDPYLASPAIDLEALS